MDTFKSFIGKLYQVNDNSFEDIALQVFRFQAHNNNLYKEYLQHLRVVPGSVRDLNSIPFLPISFFKTHTIQTGQWEPIELFKSSGTTNATPSSHAVEDLSFYLAHAVTCFEHFFGPLQKFHFLALLPSYLERQGSSLIAMLDHFIKESGSEHSGFYLYNHDQLLEKVSQLRHGDRQVVVWGVSFALLDLAEKSPDLNSCVIFETGGMKGRRKEITRQELHALLKERLNVAQIYSEYGMTELFSQAYTKGSLHFSPPPAMRVIGRDMTDPMVKGLVNENAGLNIIDLANLHSVAFIETEDVGKVYDDGSFEVLGRFDNSEIRGCNLLL